MGRYKIRKAQPGETPGYYTREQVAMRKFVSGGMQEEAPAIDLAQIVSDLSSYFVNTIMKDPDPENADIRPLMSQKAAELQQMNLDPSAIQSIINGAGKQALQTVANFLGENEDEEDIVTADNNTEVDTDTDEEESTTDYGYYDDSTASDDGEDDQMINDMLMSSSALEGNDPNEYKAFKDVMKYGGSNGKRKFIRETMSRLSKAEEGMEQQDKNTAALRGTADDIKGNYLTSKETFVPAVKQNAQNAVNKKFAEQQYESMMNQEFQFGGANRRLRRANRAMFGTPYAPPGVNADYKFGLLGGLRSANVSWDPRMMQGMFGFGSVMPGMMQGYSGGWYSPTYKIKGTRVKSASEDISAIGAKAINSAALDKVAKDTPNSDATSQDKNLGQIGADAAKNSGLDAGNPNSGSTPGTANAELNQGTAGDGTSNNQRRNVSQPKKKKDAWGRSEGDRWYGFDPDKAKQKVKVKPLSPEEAKKRMQAWDKKMGLNKDINKWGYSGKNRKPQASYADDELIQDLVLGIPGIKDAMTFGARMIGNIGSRGFGNNPKGLPNSQRQLGNNQKQLPGGSKQLGSGSNPKQLGPGASGSNSGSSNNLPGRPDWQRINKNQDAIDDMVDKMPYAIGEKVMDSPFSKPHEAYKNDQAILNKNKKKKKKQIGGAVNPELYKYIYGGDDIDDSDIDFNNSKDVSDAYFKHGGLKQYGPGDEVQEGENTGLTREDVEKMFEEYSKKQSNQNTGQGYSPGQYVSFGNTGTVYDPNLEGGYPGSFGSSGVGQPMWGRPSYAPGYSGRMGQYGNLFGFMTKDFDYYTPYGGGKQGNIAVDPMQAYGASLANIQKSGMVPTGMKYSKERKQDGNWFERKLGFNKDRVYTFDFAKPGSLGQGQPSNDLDNNGIPDNIQSNSLDPNLVNKQGQTSGSNQPTGNTSTQTQGSNIYSNTEGLSNRAQRKIRRGERRTARQLGRGENMMTNEPNSISPNNISPDVMKQAVITGCFGGNCIDKSPEDWTYNQPAMNYMNQSLSLGQDNTSNNTTVNNGFGPNWQLPGQTPEEAKAAMDEINAMANSNTNNKNASTVTNQTIKATPEQEKLNLTSMQNNPMMMMGNSNSTNSQTQVNGAPFNNVGPMNIPEEEPGMAYGGYVPAFAFEDGGYIPEYLIAGEVNNQLNPMGNSVPSWVTDPIGTAIMDSKQNMLDNCTEEEKQDPSSPCYEKDTEQIKLKKETAKTFHPDRLANTLKAGARSFVTNMDQLQGFKNNYVPAMQNLAYADQPSRQRIETGPWEENSGTFNKMGFEGVVKKGGTTGLKQNGEYQLTMDQIREILKAGGKVEFL
jgi:hypothetical protein